MAKVKTTRYFLNVFGSIQRDFQTLAAQGSNNAGDVFEYTFKTDEEFFQHFQKLNVKTDKGKLLKGNTLIGVYDRGGKEKWDRPRPRISGQKFKDKQKS